MTKFFLVDRLFISIWREKNWQKKSWKLGQPGVDNHISITAVHGSNKLNIEKFLSNLSFLQFGDVFFGTVFFHHVLVL